MKRSSKVLLIVGGVAVALIAGAHLLQMVEHGHFANLHGAAGLHGIHASGPAGVMIGDSGGDPLANARARDGVAAIGTRWDEAAFEETVALYTDVHRGVKWLSTTNVVLALFLIVFVFFAGPTLFILDAWPSAIGGYLTDLVGISSATGAFGGAEWMGTWTIFYWAWWLSWAPFVGTFIARISRGRTIRQFVVGVLLIPSAASTLWFAILGGTAL